jgi:hypothetical protein
MTHGHVKLATNAHFRMVFVGETTARHPGALVAFKLLSLSSNLRLVKKKSFLLSN